MRLALYQPDIPQNTGTILRLAACLGVGVDIVGPAGFDISGQAMRRAGLDYLQHVDLARHVSFAAFDAWRRREGEYAPPTPGVQPIPRLVLLTARGDVSHIDFAFHADDVLMLGRESAGVPTDVHRIADARVAIPMRPNLRSLNVAVAAAIVLGEALRQTGGWHPFESLPAA